MRILGWIVESVGSLDGVERVGQLHATTRQLPQRRQLVVDQRRHTQRLEHAPRKQLRVAAVAPVHQVEQTTQQQQDEQHAHHGRYGGG